MIYFQGFDLPHTEPIYREKSPSPIVILPTTRSGHKCRAPCALRDFVLSSTVEALSEHVAQLVPAAPAIPMPPLDSPQEASIDQGSLNVLPPDSVPTLLHHKVLQTEPNLFEVFCRYFCQSNKDSEMHIPSDSLCDSPSIAMPSSNATSGPIHPFGSSATITSDSQLS